MKDHMGFITEVTGRCGKMMMKAGFCLNGMSAIYAKDIIKENWLFRKFVLQPDIKKGIKFYESKKPND